MIRLSAGPHGCEDTPHQAHRAHLQKLTEIAALIDGGMSICSAADLVGVSPAPDPATLPKTFAFTPTPDQIAQMCLEIQASWGPVEQESRRTIRVDTRWRPPMIATREFGAA